MIPDDMDPVRLFIAANILPTLIAAARDDADRNELVVSATDYADKLIAHQASNPVPTDDNKEPV